MLVISLFANSKINYFHLCSDDQIKFELFKINRNSIQLSNELIVIILIIYVNRKDQKNLSLLLAHSKNFSNNFYAI